MEFMTIKEAAEKWNLSVRRVQTICNEGMIEGAMKFGNTWSYHIIGERLIAYKYGKTSEVQVQNIEKSLNTIIEQFEEMKKDLVFLLSENEDQQN